MDRTRPASNELEVSVFGRGYGEALCIHIGSGVWVLVDSCLEPDSNEPAALTYLAELGCSRNDVAVVIATHWHDDHVQGFGRIVKECPQAVVVCSAVVARREFIVFVFEQEGERGALGSGLDEFRTVLTTCAENGRSIVWAKANTHLFPLPPKGPDGVFALSPSDDAFQRSLEDLIATASRARSTVRRRVRAPEGPNGASVVAWVQYRSLRLLLGADMESSPNGETGWSGILKYSKRPELASLLKIPHHGGQSAHHDGMWSDLLEPQPVSIVTPWIRGSKFLPTKQDVERLKRHSGRSYITALPDRVMTKKKTAHIVKSLHPEPLRVLRGWGHVRARRRDDETTWRVELDGDAIAL